MSDNIKMDPEVKAKWVAALRSGDYKQGEGALKDIEGCNCCLGVLAEINGVESRFYDEENDCWVTHDDNHLIYDFEGDERSTEVPVGYCGLKSSVIDTLIVMNDTENKTFPEIADFIEENL